MISNSKKEEKKNGEDKNIQKLREEFNKRQSKNENHPRTSHGYKRSTDRYNININQNNKYSRYNKAMSANKFKQKVKNNSNLNNKIIYDFCKKHPGYLYYKEVMLNNKNKKRSLTGKNKLPKIKNKDFNEINEIVGKKSNYNHNQNHYNFNNKTNDKNNPYSFFWANRILNRNNFRIDIKGMTYGVPKLGSTNRKEDVLLKMFNNNLSKANKNKKYNNFMNTSNRKIPKNENLSNDNKNNNNKCYKINSYENNLDNKMKNINDVHDIDKKEEKNNKNNNEANENEVENESYDEEQQKQFYTNQKNFFKARKDIKEEPEYLEEDNEMNENIEKEKDKE